MRIIDVHTHMLTGEYIETLRSTPYSGYDIRATPSGDAVYRGDTPFMTLTPQMFDWQARIADMDAAGVEVAVTSLTCPNVYWGGRDTSVLAAQAINDDMAKAAMDYPGRVRFFASLPWQYPQDAVAELARARGLGASGVMVLANIAGAPLTDPRFAAIWQAIDDVQLPVLVHPTAPPGSELMSLSSYHLAFTVGFTFDTTLALARMIMDGFLDRYPNLKIIGGHAGGYLPFLIGRLDKGFECFAQCRQNIDRPPSTYLKQLYVDAIVYDPRALAFTIDVIGADHVLFGSDYPHKNGRMEDIKAFVQTLPRKSAALISHENAERCGLA